MQVTPKALPSSGSLAVINRSISRTKLTNFKPTSSTTEEGGKIVKSIESKIITVEKVIESKTLFKSKVFKDSKKLEEKKKRKEKEDRLEETKDEKKVDKKKGFSLPGKNIFNRLRNFILGALLGWLFNKYGDKLPEILKFFSETLPKIFEKVENIVGSIFNGVVSFIDKGYELYEKFENFAVDTLGFDQKVFDDFTEKLNKFVNFAIIAGIFGSGGGLPGLPGRKRDKIKEKVSKVGSTLPQSQLNKNLRADLATTRRALLGDKGAKGQIYRQQLNRIVKPGQTPSGIKMGPRPGSLLGKSKGFLANLQTGTANIPLSPKAQRELFKAPQQLKKVLNGIKSASAGAKSLMGRIPYLGALISGLYTYFEDVDPIDGKPDKKLDKVLFTTSGTALGGFLGSFIPIPFIGTALGALLGEYVGELFYALIKGGGINAVTEKLKKDITGLNKILNGNPEVGDVRTRSVGRGGQRRTIYEKWDGKKWNRIKKDEYVKTRKESDAGEPGNLIQASHPHTGRGFSIKGLVDEQGRPAVFSKSAAAAFGKMMMDSKGVVKGSDISSSQRSKEWNAEVGGAENSYHLYGEAVDIHGDSNNWIRKHGAKYGWKPNDYSGSHGGHFEFKGLEGGGSIGPKRNIGALKMQTDYEDDYVIMIQPVIIEKVVPVKSDTVSFPSSTSVNSSILETFTR